MALKTAVVHYTADCDMPACMCVDCDVFVHLKGDLLTTDGLPYIMATVVSIIAAASGGIDVTLHYDNATLPVDGSDPIDLVFGSGEDANACDPDCAGNCDWMTKVKRMIESALPGGLINRHYQLYVDGETVENGAFLLPRIPFEPGFRLTDVRITCFVYDINTEGTFQLKVGASVKAEFIGNLAQQRQLTILVPDLANDALPELHITGLTNGVYGLAAEGFVIELIGIVQPSP